VVIVTYDWIEAAPGFSLWMRDERLHSGHLISCIVVSDTHSVRKVTWKK